MKWSVVLFFTWIDLMFADTQWTIHSIGWHYRYRSDNNDISFACYCRSLRFVCMCGMHISTANSDHVSIFHCSLFISYFFLSFYWYRLHFLFASFTSNTDKVQTTRNRAFGRDFHRIFPKEIFTSPSTRFGWLKIKREFFAKYRL